MTSVLECSGVRRSLASGMKPRYTYMIHPSDTPYDTPRPQFRRAYWVQNCSTVDPSAQCVAPQERWNLSNLSPPCTLMSPELVLTRIWSTAPRTAGWGKCLERRGGQEEDLGGRTLGSKPYFTSLYSSATLSPLVFVWNFHRVFFVGGRDVTINLTYWSHPTISMVTVLVGDMVILWLIPSFSLYNCFQSISTIVKTLFSWQMCSQDPLINFFLLNI